MKEPRFPSVRILLLMAVLALAGFAAGPAGAFAAPAVETGRIRMEGVHIRTNQWISVGETDFHPDQTLQPGGPVRKAPPPRGPEPARESERPSGSSPPPVPETRLNRIEMPLRLSEAGMLGGIGFGRLPEGHYEPILVAAHFGLNLGPFLHIPETHMGQGSALNIGYRVRHLSNGGARVPNTGINNHLLVVGYSMFLDAPAEKERME